MTTYRHPRLNVTAVQQKSEKEGEGYLYNHKGEPFYVANRGSPIYGDKELGPLFQANLLVDQLLALGFEEVKEVKEEVEYWIDTCVDEIFEYQRGRPKENETDFASVRKIIEKHMPKQKKLTIDEVVYMFGGNLTVNNRYIQEKKERAICFLRARGLLEE